MGGQSISLTMGSFLIIITYHAGGAGRREISAEIFRRVFTQSEKSSEIELRNYMFQVHAITVFEQKVLKKSLDLYTSVI